jgi:hypothetical protein
VLVLAAPHERYCSLDIGRKDVVDVWGVMGRGIQL